MNRTIKIIDNIKAEWSEHQKDLAAAGLNYREAGLLVKGAKNLALLETLMAVGGPFTTPDEVDAYVSGGDSDDVKQKRMRAEVTYARDISLWFPVRHEVFRIYDTSGPGWCRVLFSAAQFGNHLKAYLGKCTGRAYITLEEYRNAVNLL